jgi:hypothetical protein
MTLMHHPDKQALFLSIITGKAFPQASSHSINMVHLLSNGNMQFKHMVHDHRALW